MPNPCPCCHHRQRVLIDLALDQQQPLRTIQTRWGVSRSALLHHRDCCLRPPPAEGDAYVPVQRVSTPR
jgi:hypothetical protein